MTTINQKEYLKKYLAIGKTPGEKKKRKKKEKSVGNRLKIIDDDIDVAISQEIAEDLAAENEDAPQIVAIIDDRPPSLQIDEKTKSNLWMPIGEPSNAITDIQSLKLNSFKLSKQVTSTDSTKSGIKVKQESSQGSRSKYSSFSKSERSHSPSRSLNSDSSSPRIRSKHYTSEKGGSRNEESSLRDEKFTHRRNREDDSPLRRKRDEDNSPPRIRIKEEDSSPPRKQNAEEDSSPPRKRNRKEDNSPIRRRYELDNSPPRRKNREEDIPRRRNRKEEHSQARRRNEEERSSLRRKNREIDISPPRRRHREDHSPARRKNEGDCSPPRRRNIDEDHSPVRRKVKEEYNSPVRRIEEDSSPPRRKNRENNSPPPRSKSREEGHSREKRKSRWNAEHSPDRKMQKTLDGKIAGLQNAKDLVKETRFLREKEDEIFKTMSAEVSGRNAATVVRGKKVESLEEEAAKAKREKEMKEKYDRWGKGLKQVEDRNQQIEDQVHEMSKPLARYADDEDLEKFLKEQEREGDPMLAYIRKKKKKDKVAAGIPEKPTYMGEFMPNRFGIPPGYRWDGVDRSNGYERKWFQVQNAKKADREEALKWSTEDM